MLARVSDELLARPSDSVLCLFGDHLPSFPKLFRSLDYTDDRVDYLVWRRSGGAGTCRDLNVEALGGVVLNAVGISLEPEEAVM